MTWKDFANIIRNTGSLVTVPTKDLELMRDDLDEIIKKREVQEKLDKIIKKHEALSA